MLNRKIVRAARVRFVEALYKRHAVSGLRLGMDIARTISKRTGVPVAAIVAAPGEDSLTWGAARIKRHKAWADLRMVSASSLALEVD
jgi:hypothetical protein